MGRLALALLVALPTLANADEQWGPPPTAVQPSSVRGVLDGSVAILKLRYELDVAGPKLVRHAYDLDIPADGVVTGATVTVDGAAHPLPLADAIAAVDAVDALGSAAGVAPWAFRIYRDLSNVSSVALDVGAPHRAHVAVELEIQAAACYFRDARYVAIDPAWLPHVDRALRAPSSPALLAAYDASDGADKLAWLRFASPVVAGDVGVAITADKLALESTSLARIEVDLASHFTSVPADLYTVLVVDNSRSLDDKRRAEQRALVASYLAAAPNGHVQVVAVDRHARTLLPAWSVASAARAKVDTVLGALAPANGSNLDEGLAAAAHALDGQPGTHRVIVFTDEQLPWHVAVAKLAPPIGALVHAVALHGEHGALVRDDTTLLANLAARTEGVGFTTDAPGTTADALELVRPIAIDDLCVSAPGWGLACGKEALAEGHAREWSGQGSGGPIRLTGRIWNRAFERTLVASDDHALELARRSVAQTASYSSTTAPELAHAARAVDDAWSLADAWSGRGGYAGHVVERIPPGSFGCGCMDSGRDGGKAIMEGLTVQLGTLAQQLERATAKCQRENAAVDVELTDNEIVDVSVHGGDEACITDAVWAAPVELSRRGHRLEHVEL